MKTLTTEQQDAIVAAQSVCVIASAGTGKTTVLTERFLHAHHNLGVNLPQILAFTFTEAAAREMKERILISQGIGLFDLPFLKVSTIHAFCSQILRQYGHKLNLKSDFKLLDAAAAELLQDKALDEHLQNELRSGNTLLQQAYEHLGLKTLSQTFAQLAKLNLLTLTPSQLRCHPLQQHAELFQNILQSVYKWQEAELSKRLQNSTIGFDDLEILTVKLLSTEPHVLQSLQKQFQHILVDEFQDISPVQLRLIQHLHNPLFNTLFIVGDPKQSIYKFRKASSQIFFAMQEHIHKHGGVTINLHQTFRTPQLQQNRFNSLFPPLLNTAENQLFAAGLSQLKVDDAKIYRVGPADDTEDEQGSLNTQLLQILEHLKAQQTPESDIAILANTRLALSRLQQLLKAHNIPCLFESQNDILNTPLISLLVAILRFLAEPTDLLSLASVLRHDHFALTTEQQQLILKNHSKATSVELPNDTLKHFWNCFGVWQKNQYLYTPKALSEKILADLHIQPNSLEFHHLEHFLKILTSWQDQGLETLSSITDLLHRTQDQGAEIKDPVLTENCVRLLTIHAAKGLEFKHVIIWPAQQNNPSREIFLFDFVQGFLFKSPQFFANVSLNEELESFEDFAELKEELQTENQNELKRLIYVALTRTQKNLYLFYRKPSQKLMQALRKNANDTSLLKSFNDVLYWLSQSQETTDIQDFLQEPVTVTPQDRLLKMPEPIFNPAFVAAKPIWTVTELEQFAESPSLFKERYLKGWTVQDKPLITRAQPTDSFATLTGVQKGNFLHEVLQFYQPTRQNLEEVVAQTLFNQHLQIPVEDAIAQTQQLLDAFQSQKQLWQWLFDFEDSANELSFTMTLDSLILTGQIDKIVKHDGQWMILDYKTHHIPSEKHKQVLSQKFKFQLQCYALAIRQKFAQESVRAALIFTQIQEHTLFEFSEKDLDSFAREIEVLHAAFQKMF